MGIRVSTELDPRGVQKGAAVVKRSLSDVDVAMARTEKTNKRFNAGIQQAGFQISDLAVQLQGGVNPMIALTQQGSQLIGAFNPLAAAAFTVAGALGSALLPSLFDTEDATKKLTEAQESLDTILSRSEDGVVSFTDKIARLAKVNEQAARIQLAVGIADATEVIRQAAKVSNEAIDDLDPFFSIISNGTREIGAAPNVIEHFNRTLQSTGTTAEQLLKVGDLAFGGLADYIDNLNDKLGTTTPQSLQLAAAFSKFDGSAESANKLATAVAQVSEESSFTNEKLNKLAKTLGENAIEAGNAQSLISLLNTALKDTDTVVSQNTETFQSNQNVVRDLSLQLTVLQTEYTQGARAAAILEAQQRAGVSAASAQGQQIASLTGQIFDQRDAIQAAADADKERAKRAAERAAQVDAFAEAEIRSEQKRREQLSRQVGAISFGVMSPVDQLRTEEQQKLAILEEYGQLNAEAQAESERLRTAVVKQAAAERNALRQEEIQRDLSAVKAGFSDISSLFGAFAGDQENRNKTAFALQKTFAIASATVNAGLAISQALSLPTDVSLPQKFASVAAVAAAVGSVFSTINSANYATGGFVQGAGSGTSDSINANLSNGEFVTRASVTRRNRGALEFMNRTGELPGGAGGGGVVINYYGSGSVEQRQEGGLTIVDIDKRINERVPGLVADQVRNPNSQFNGAFKSTYNAPRR